MEKKKMKLWKKILILVLVIFIIFLVFTIRKIIIISSLQNKLEEYQKMNNIYTKTSPDSSVVTSCEKYYKDGVEKDVIISIEKNTKVTQYIYPNQRKVFSEGTDYKTLGIYKESNKNVYSSILVSYTASVTLSELLINSITSKISTENIDGKECYVLSSNYNLNFLYEENATNLKVYIEKDTGLTVKVIQFIKINGEESKKTIKYEYSFGTVTGEDMQEPDETYYKFLESN